MKNCIKICFLALILMFLVSGCKTTEKEAAKPDRFEKWRIMAKDSPKNTPDPRPFNEKADKDVKQVIQELEDRQEAQTVKADAPPEKKLPSMRLTMKMHDVPVAVLLRTLARAADMNIMINETVTGQAKINIVNVPWDQAFTGLLGTYGLTYKWGGDILRVITVEDLNKEIALMEATQKFQKSKKEHALAMREIAQKQEKLEPLLTRVVKINFADLAEIRDNLENYLMANSKELALKKASMGGENKNASSPNTEGFRGSILKDKNTNSLIVQATRSDIDKILPLIYKLDRPSYQIFIEAHIVEATSDTAKELGIQWGGLGEVSQSGGTKRHSIGGGSMTDFNQALRDSDGNDQAYDPTDGNISNFPITAATSGLSLGMMTQKLGEYALYAQLTALQEEGKLNILSKPAITTIDHHKASIESGKDVPFQTVEDGEVNIEWRKAVISLEVTPHVINDEIVRLDIITHKDELDFTNTVLGNPTIITKNAETMVTLFNGQTTVIGGLNKEFIEEGESGVPGLKDVPGLGWLFKSVKDGGNMEELLIFITPHILEGKNAMAVKSSVE